MRPRNNNIIWVVLVIVIIAGIYFFTKKDNTSVDQEQIQEEQTQGEQEEQSQENLLTPTISPQLLELKKLGIEVVGEPQQQEIEIPSSLSGPNWELKKTVCEDGGYDLSVYKGKITLFTSYLINETRENEQLLAWVISSEDKIVCIYKSVGSESNVSPGIFSVK